MCKVGVFNVSMLMNVFLQYIMFCDWGTIFCLEIANCKHVKTLIGNNSEKLAGNNNFVKTCNKPEKLARNNDFVKTLIGNYSEKLARNNDGWKKDNFFDKNEIWTV